MTHKLRVLEFITPSGFYGAERWVLALANHLDASQVVCDLAVTRESDDQDLTVADLYPQGRGEVHYLSMANRFDWGVVHRLARILRRRQIDIIHTHGYKSDIIGLLAARRAGIRCVSTPHGFSGKVGLKLAAFIRLGTHCLRYFDAVAPLSEELARDMRRFRVPVDKIHFIANGVDIDEIDREVVALPPSRQRPEAEKVIGFVGQMIPRKGLPDLLAVFDQLYSQNQQLRLQLLGDGRQRAELEAMAAAMPGASAIEFTGFRSDRLALMAGFDLFVMTSSLEGIPRCLMEAMALGVPVAAYDIPGVDQLISHGENGLLAPHGDREALADCCRQLLDNPKLAGRLAEAARQTIETRYSARRMAGQYLALFQQLVNTKTPVVQSPGPVDGEVR
ncbi:MAG: glycosyltransferase family 4 protein [Alteromonadaceae bacterium]|nr:glycosyltransferase family 4 protein [Alteromonadaceae bacterium]